MEYITLNEHGFAETSGWVVCYLTNPDGEYIGFADEFIPATAGLPAGAYIDEPPADEEGKAIIRVGDRWELVDDHRGKTVYSTADGQPIEITAPGVLPENTTLLKPSTPYDAWNGNEWVTNTADENAAIIAAANSEKARLRSIADAEIVWRQDAIDAGIATEDEINALAEWKKYRVLLMRVDTTKAPYINWPSMPV
ncbi:tail fiber assembly protein [Atlantibacter sp.]|uniref:tail fiber assembly protein n=1 Tax=Atlantibacter sp. TaxID=1903473 RepID=UPI0028AA6E9A|nr:tail fiber assembly protein [Atlantibacter sp.]